MLIALTICASSAAYGITVVDDAGNSVRLSRPAQRIISLSPGTTESLFAAGAGMKVVGSVAPSDYPAAAASIAVVGDGFSIDPERIAALAPDLIVAWPHGAAQRQMAQLRRLGVPVFVSDPRSLAEIASSLEAFGRLADTGEVAAAAAASFRNRIDALRRSHADAAPLRVFLQIWGQPPMTVNDRHPIADVLRLCGGRNIFATAYPLAPTVGFEAVVAANPQAIAAIASRKPAADWLAAWRRWPGIAAVRANATFAIEPDLITRPTPRIVEGADALCKNLDLIRQRLATAP